MKRIFLFIPVLLLFSCLKDDPFPLVENITKGSKWGLKIGSSAEETYAQLQKLGKEKEFDETTVIYRKPFSKPADIQHQIQFYAGLTLQSPDAHIHRVVFQFKEDRIMEISVGGAMPDQVSKWPEDVSDEMAIHENDPLDEIYPKLLAIYALPAYQNYQLTLPNKPLSRAFDPGMRDYNEWAFVFFEDVSSLRSGRSSVRLYFKNGKLSKIHHQYDESEVVI